MSGPGGVGGLSLRLRIVLAEQGQHQAEIATAAGISDRHLRRLLDEGDAKRGASIGTIQALAEALRVRPGWLAFGEGERAEVGAT